MPAAKSKEHYDVIVIGGGPGGSAAGTLLAKYGKKVLLIEREKFPRYHIGESLLSGTLEIFDKLGVLEKLDKTFVKKWGVEWVWGVSRNKWTTYFKDAVSIPHDYGYQVERAEFDKILLDNAAENGVEVHEQCSAIEPLMNGNRVAGIHYRHTQTGQDHEVYARFVVDASGQGGFLTSRLQERHWDPILRNMAVWSYWRNAKRNPGIDEGNTFLPTFSEGWWWFIPQRDEITSIGAVIDRDNYDKVKAIGPEAFYEDAISRTPELAERLKGAERIEGIRTLRDWSYEYERFFGSGYIAVGDAACFIDPLFSTGVHLALLAGYMASLAVNTILDKEGSDEMAILSFYEKQYKRDYKRFKDQVYFLYAGQAATQDDYFWKARNVFDNPKLDSRTAFISLIAGSFEHRGWYHRCLKRMGSPEDLGSYIEAVSDPGQFESDPAYFKGRLRQDKPWTLLEDFAVEGNYLIPVQSIHCDTGTEFPLTPLLQDIASHLSTHSDGSSAADIIDLVSANGRYARKDIHGTISDAVAHGVLTLA